MIPAPPADQALPGLATVFDEDAMIPLLSRALDAAGGPGVTGYAPRYIRYKPGTSCLVQVDLAFRDATGGAGKVSAHLKLFVDERARRRAESSRMRRQEERARVMNPGLPWRRAAFIPELNALLQVYPVDYDLRFLVRAVDPGWIAAKIGHALSDRSIAIRGWPELVRYKPERKALVRYDLSHGPHDRIYGKLYEDDRGVSLTARTAALIKAGVATPPVVLSLPDRQFVACAEAEGTQLAALRGAPGYAGWMEPLATALHRLQGVELPGLAVHRLADEAETIRATARLLGTVTPDLASRLDRIAQEIARRLSGVDDKLQTGHGDFYDDQAIVSGDRLTLIDLDELRLAHPAIDTANMLAHLAAGGARGDGVAQAREEFRETVLSRQPEREADLPAFEAAALLKLAPGPFRRLEPDWPVGIERILELTERRLQQRQPVHGPENPGSIDDPLLPQLARVRDPEAMAQRLSCVVGDASVTDAHLVRHKPGRRAIVGYDLDSGEHLYGKTFASERGPKVYRIAQRICSARAFGPDVALPEPVAYLADLKLLIQRTVAGEPVERALRGGETRLAVRIADALHRFHDSGLDLGRTHDLAKELSPLEMRTEAVVAHCPDLDELAWPLHERIEALENWPYRWRNCPVHRDFYHDQVLIDEERLAVLDLDDAAMSEPAIDIANFAAHLRLLGFQHPGDSAALARVEAAFVERAVALDPDLDPGLLQFLNAATMLRLAGIHVARANGRDLARRLLRAASLGLNEGSAFPTVRVPDRRAVRQ